MRLTTGQLNSTSETQGRVFEICLLCNGVRLTTAQLNNASVTQGRVSEICLIQQAEITRGNKFITD